MELTDDNKVNKDVDDFKLDFHEDVRAIFENDRLKPYREGYEKAEKYEKEHLEKSLSGKLPRLIPHASSQSELKYPLRKQTSQRSQSQLARSASSSSQLKGLHGVSESKQMVATGGGSHVSRSKSASPEPPAGKKKRLKKRRRRKKRETGKDQREPQSYEQAMADSGDLETLRRLPIKDRLAAIKSGKVEYLRVAESTLARPTRGWFGFAFAFSSECYERTTGTTSTLRTASKSYKDKFLGSVSEVNTKKGAKGSLRTVNVNRFNGSLYNSIFGILQGYGSDGSPIAHYCATLVPYLIHDAWKRLQTKEAQQTLRRSTSSAYVFGSKEERKTQRMQNVMTASLRGATRALHHAIIHSPYAGSETNGVTGCFALKMHDWIALANVGAHRAVMGRSRTYHHINHGDFSNEDILTAYPQFPELPFKIANALWFPRDDSKNGVPMPEDCAMNEDRFTREMEFTAEGARGEQRSRDEQWISHFDNVVAIPLTVDQVPERPDERKRLSSWTGNGGLGGVSVVRVRQHESPYRRDHVVYDNTRSFQAEEGEKGDDDVEKLSGVLPFLLNVSRMIGCEPAQRLGAIAEPEASVFKVDPSDAFLLLASESVWRYISSQGAVNIVSNCIKECTFGGSDSVYCRGKRVEAFAENTGESEEITPEEKDMHVFVGAAGSAGQYTSACGGGLESDGHELPDVPDAVDRACNIDQLKVRHAQMRNIARIAAQELLKEVDKLTSSENLVKEMQFSAIVVLFDHRPKAYFKRTHSNTAFD
eukprot:gb/GECG01002556.1/.p1 GENE.gb/GECG01002556.1/~~gb/GECG01002556.1/.p1  ORF type:complete len:763 (+),score=100.47 gb/GECG01002556.1/:1-2289(+)